MSQYPATERRSSRRSGQILQHTAIVFAGMASIGLTVAAGSYVVDQIAESTRPPDAGRPAPNAAVPAEAPAFAPDNREYPRGAAAIEQVGLAAGQVSLAAESRRVPVALLAPHTLNVPRPTDTPRAPQIAQRVGHVVLPTAPHRPADQSGMGGRLRLPGGAYVGADIGPGGPNSVSMTVDTDAFATSTGRPGPAAPDTASQVTRFRTDLDTDSGEVTLAVSGPLLGQHDMRLQRHPRPDTTAPPTSATDVPATVRPEAETPTETLEAVAADPERAVADNSRTTVGSETTAATGTDTTVAAGSDTTVAAGSDTTVAAGSEATGARPVLGNS
ncbi:hypothetical protein [Nocardia sp. BMG51109]|uniref:hypothetical protein n=1 Tax=Nocardia sp. BMG51109 TaxID=1056816 RepID=UPI0004B1565D|nr:hypothetical protein [Nocardia sp. BMG51109]